MERRIMLWVVIGVLFLTAIFFAFKLGASNSGVSSLTGNAVAGDSGKLDTTGWTENEIMNYEMHGTIPARVGSSAPASAPTMVGSC